MPDEIPTLWPDSFGTPDLPTPVSILKKQGTALADATKGLVEGRVGSSSSNNVFTHNFDLIAPVLGYKYRLLQARHEITLYPVVLTDHARSTQFTGTTVDQFIEQLRDILQGDKTRQIVQSLIVQSREA